MILLMKNIHLLGAILFALYILIDRAYVRIFVEKNSREKFYKRVKYPMLFISVCLLVSGAVLVSYSVWSWLLFAKLLSAFLLLFGFFFCPVYMKKNSSIVKQMMYRWGVVGLLITTLSLAVAL